MSMRELRLKLCAPHLLVILLLISVLSFISLVTLRYNAREAYTEQVSSIIHNGLGRPGRSADSVTQISLEFQRKCNIKNALTVTGLDKMTFEDAIKELFRRDGQTDVQKIDCPRNPRRTPTRRKLGLVSFPGSGNTWTRHLLHQMTGYVTGFVNWIPERKNYAIVLKTHEASKPYDDASPVVVFERMVLLLRNPYDANVAEFKNAGLRLGKVGEAAIDPKSTKWQGYVENRLVTLWPSFLRHALTHQEPMHIMFYEDLQTALLPELLALASFLNDKDITRFSLCCAIHEYEGLYHRKRLNNSNVHLYSSEMKFRMNAQLDRLADEYRWRFPLLSERLREYKI